MRHRYRHQPFVAPKDYEWYPQPCSAVRIRPVQLGPPVSWRPLPPPRPTCCFPSWLRAQPCPHLSASPTLAPLPQDRPMQEVHRLTSFSVNCATASRPATSSASPSNPISSRQAIWELPSRP